MARAYLPPPPTVTPGNQFTIVNRSALQAVTRASILRVVMIQPEVQT